MAAYDMRKEMVQKDIFGTLPPFKTPTCGAVISERIYNPNSTVFGNSPKRLLLATDGHGTSL